MKIEMFDSEQRCCHCKKTENTKAIDFEFQQIALCDKCRHELLRLLTPEFPVRATVTTYSL
jgi:NAD-dependent SIR2 family protein deacetylase